MKYIIPKNKPLTRAEQKEIQDFIHTVDPNGRTMFLRVEKRYCWIVYKSGAVMHPRTFLDIIHGDGHGENILK